MIGDDVLSLLSPDINIWETGEPLSKLKGDLVSANAYIGAHPILVALNERADIVITGRCADPSLFLAPLLFEFGWKADEWDLLGAGCHRPSPGMYHRAPGVITWTKDGAGGP